MNPPGFILELGSDSHRHQAVRKRKLQHNYGRRARRVLLTRS